MVPNYREIVECDLSIRLITSNVAIHIPENLFLPLWLWCGLPHFWSSTMNARCEPMSCSCGPISMAYGPYHLGVKMDKSHTHGRIETWSHTHGYVHMVLYPWSYGPIPMVIWSHTCGHVVPYLWSYGPIPMVIWSHTYGHMVPYPWSYGPIPMVIWSHTYGHVVPLNQDELLWMVQVWSPDHCCGCSHTTGLVYWCFGNMSGEFSTGDKLLYTLIKGVIY